MTSRECTKGDILHKITGTKGSKRQERHLRPGGRVSKRAGDNGPGGEPAAAERSVIRERNYRRPTGRATVDIGRGKASSNVDITVEKQQSVSTILYKTKEIAESLEFIQQESYNFGRVDNPSRSLFIPRRSCIQED
ncbi:hypothetical protein EVAR_46253_1 [Eumeta japonica]|uniref:Uncharacterized protein n=1 Tax=Eumeta variegata TaxID=151549 RepID=A0A4C1Y6B0_EUMVA|nr:hypothetical protein EVAR_46253_1 [Eumeta japonica]